MTTVIAGTGFGKTQAVISFTKPTNRNIIWLQLSSLDNLPIRLWERSIFSLATHYPLLAKRLSGLRYPNTPSSFSRFLYSLNKAMQHRDPFIFILDDFHFIKNKILLGFIQKIISFDFQNISFILISRTTLRLDLSFLDSVDELSLITEKDLRFTKEEMITYYQHQNIFLNDTMSADIFSYTNGWITALQLVGIVLNQGNYKTPLSTAKHDIFDLIEKEIFSTISIDMQHFLISLSLLDSIPIGFAIELINHNLPWIFEIIDIHQFLQYDFHSNTYLIRTLFRTFLSEKRYLLSISEMQHVHLRAAKWYEHHNQLLKAIHHYKECNCCNECNCYHEIFNLLLKFSRCTSKESANLFINLIDQAPTDMLEAYPIMFVVKAYYLFNNNKINAAEKILLFLDDHCQKVSVAQYHALLGESYLLLALINIVKQNLKFVKYLKIAVAFSPHGSILIDHTSDIAEGLNVCGIRNSIPGELSRYQNALLQVAPYATQVMNGCCYGIEILNVADTLFMTGNIRQAEVNAYEAIARAKEKQQLGIQYLATFILIRIHMYKGNYCKIDAFLKQLEVESTQHQSSYYLSLHDIIKSWFFVKIGAFNQTPPWIMQEENSPTFRSPIILGYEHLIRSDCLLMKGYYYKLLAFIEKQDVIYNKRGYLYGLIQNKLLESITYHYLDNHEASLCALEKSYDLSYGNNLVIQFIEYGNKMRTVIKAARQDPNCLIPITWLDKLYARASTYGKRLSQVVNAYRTNMHISTPKGRFLTAKESLILSYICRGLTKEEIAAFSNISVHTVKSMTLTIYNKIGAKNKMDAIRIATSMNFPVV